MRASVLKSIVILAILITSGCSRSPNSSNAQPTSAEASTKPAATEPVTGQTAFWAMYKLAFSWARDLQPLTLDSGTLPDMKCEAGKAPVWKANFASPSLHQARTFTYSIVQTADLNKGVNVGPPIAWGGPTQNVMVIPTGLFHTDSDVAYKAAMADADVWLKKNPDKPVSISLGRTYRFAAPVWYVLWGNSKSGYAVFIDADTGKVVRRK